MVWIQWKFLRPGFLRGPGWLAHYVYVSNTLLLALYKEAHPVLWGTRWHGCKVTGEQRLEWWQCRGQRLETATRAERPKSRDQLATCRLALSGQNSSGLTWYKVRYKLFYPKNSFTPFFGLIESIVNLPRAETHWQDTWYKFFLMILGHITNLCF